MDGKFAKSNVTMTTLTTITDSFNILDPLENLEYFVLSLMIIVLAITGIIGNIPVLIVYFRRKDKKASNTFIKVLAFVDLLVCCTVMPYSIVYEFHMVTSDFTCRFFEVLRHFTVLSSNITLVAIATERYIAVCQIGTKISIRGINRGVVAIILFSLTVSAPSVGIFAVVDKTEVEEIPCMFPHEKTHRQFCHFTYTIIGEMAVKAYQSLQAVLFFIEFIVIVILYTIIYVVLWNKTKIRRELTKRRTSTQVIEKLENQQENESLFSDGGMEKPYENQDSSNDKEDSSSTPTGTSSRMSQTLPVAPNENDFDSINDQNVVCKAETKVTFQRTPEKLPISDVIVSADEYGKSVTNVPVTIQESGRKINVSFCASEKPRKKRYYHRRTAKMLFLCTIIYFVTWMPFWLDIFGLTHSLILRYLFFIGHASNPIVYGIVNEQVRRSFKKLLMDILRKWCKIGKDGADDFTMNGSTSGTNQ